MPAPSAPTGPWFWRLQPSGQLVSPRPARLHRFWEGLPAQVRVVQAAYARPRDGRILLFSGEWGPGRGRRARARGSRGRPGAGPRFWVFQDRLLEGAPRPLEELGLPPGEEVDAVFSWPLNGKTYLVRGQRYWRFDEAAGRADPGYPRDLGLWEGAPAAPDDVTVSNTGGRAGEAGGPGARRAGAGGPGQPRAPPSPQVTPTSSRAPTTGAFPRAASRRSRTPRSPWAPRGWTARRPALARALPGPPKRPRSRGPASVSARSAGLRGGRRGPSCWPSGPCCWGAPLLAEARRGWAARPGALPPGLGFSRNS